MPPVPDVPLYFLKKSVLTGNKLMKAWRHLNWDFFLFKIRETLKRIVAVMKLHLIVSVSERLLTSFGDFMHLSQVKHLFLSEDLRRANTHRLTHCLFRFNSSERNPGVPYAVSLRAGSSTANPPVSRVKAPRRLPSAPCLGVTEMTTRGKYKALI